MSGREEYCSGSAHGLVVRSAARTKAADPPQRPERYQRKSPDGQTQEASGLSTARRDIERYGFLRIASSIP